MNKLLDKYKKIPAPVKAGLWFFICTVLQKGIVFLTVPIFTRLLTTEQYGLLTVYQSWMAIISVFTTLNLSAGVFKLFNQFIISPKVRSNAHTQIGGVFNSGYLSL